jgi:hypothetical protein
MMRWSLLGTLLLTGCVTTISKEEFVRVASTHDVQDVKWVFGGRPVLGFRLDRESVLFRVSPADRLSNERLEELRSQIVDRLDGLVAGYQWATANPTGKPEQDPLKSPDWNRGFSTGRNLRVSELEP